MKTNEDFRPPIHMAPNSLINKSLFTARLAADFQFLTIYQSLRQFFDKKNGHVLDVGCGNSPYRHLTDKNVKYTGLDVRYAEEFGYKNPEIVLYDGVTFPFANDTFDLILCSEVLEHVEHPEQFLTEIHRVLKKGGEGILTVPWSARFHHIPHDYFRYTPTSLKKLFGIFAKYEIAPRGNDITVISSKFITLYSRVVSGFFQNLRSCRLIRSLLSLALAMLLLPAAICSIVIGHFSLITSRGSSDDPLGYTIYFSK